MRFAPLALAFLAGLGASACHRLPQERAAKFLDRGKHYLDRKDYGRAELEFKNAAELLPKDAEPVYRLGRAYLAEGNLDRGIAALFRATRIDPNHAGARTEIAHLMAMSGDSGLAKESERRMREMLESFPGSVEALNVLALSELALGQFEDAEAHLRQAIERLPNNLSSATGLALVYISRQEYDAAEQVLKQAQASAPQSMDALLALAEFYTLRGRLPDAETSFRKALALSSADPDALLGLAVVETRLRNRQEAEDAYRKLENVSDKRYQHLHAVYLFSEGRRDEALQEFEKLAQRSSGDRNARSRLVAAYLATGHLANAEKVLNAAVKENSHDTDALLQRSQILLHLGKTGEAENDLNQVLHFNPDSAKGHYLLAQVHEARADRARQNAELVQALHFDSSLAPARADLARLLVLSGSSRAALEVLDAAPKEQQGNLRLTVGRNLAYYAAGDIRAFREGTAKALQIARTPDTLLQNAVAKLTLRDYATAQASIDEVLKQDPDNLRALKAKAATYAEQNQPKQASSFLREYAIKSKSAEVQQFAAEWLWSQGDRAGARALWLRAKALNSGYIAADLALADADLSEGKLDDARARLTRVLVADTRNVPALALLAEVESRANNVALAITRYRQALDLEPRNVEVLNNLAYLLADKTDQTDEALKYAQQAVEAMPENPDTAGTLGWILYRKGHYEEARRQLERASVQDGRGTGVNAVIRRYHLAMDYFKLGEGQKGREFLSLALRQNPNLPEATTARAAVR